MIIIVVKVDHKLFQNCREIKILVQIHNLLQNECVDVKYFRWNLTVDLKIPHQE